MFDWEREYIWIVCLLTRAPSGHYVNDVWPYVRISDRIRFAGSDWVKWVKVLRRFVGVIRVGLELGFEGVNWVNEPVLLGGAIPNRTGDLSRAVGAVKSLTTSNRIQITPVVHPGNKTDYHRTEKIAINLFQVWIQPKHLS